MAARGQPTVLKSTPFFVFLKTSPSSEVEGSASVYPDSMFGVEVATTFFSSRELLSRDMVVGK